MGLSDSQTSLQLDEVLLTFMDQLEELEEKRGRLNSLIEQGWFSMSQARYSMGNKQVSSLQYGSEMEPLVRVHARTLTNGDAEFHTERITRMCDDNEKDSKPVEDIGPKEEGVRRRAKAKKDGAEYDVDEKPSSKTENAPVGYSSKPTKSEHNPQQDPLKWFGILVPQSLKQAQSSFKQGIELSAEIAALQSEVLRTRRQLQQLLKDKQSLPEKMDATT
ncbi:coiled-coil domain-containing protein 115 [Osmerus eperlanus]|uniref:coiled-coil domain-containing protein 115 n=1 Tax=Osmerus eperlanus TaxID=29151 RepID=UPI002E111624